MKLTILILAWLLAMPASAEILAVSREANLALVGGKTPEIWSVRPWQRRLKIQTAFQPSYCYNALSRDGKLAALGRDNSTIEIFETRSGRLWKRLGRAQAWRRNGENVYDDFKVKSLAFSPDRHLLASGNRKGVFVWRVRDGKLLLSRPLAFVIPGDRQRLKTPIFPALLRFSPDGRKLAIGGAEVPQLTVTARGTLPLFKTFGIYPLFLFHVRHNRLRHLGNVVCEDGNLQAMAFSPRGNQVVVCSYWRVSASAYDQYHLFDARTGRLIWKRESVKLEVDKTIGDTHNRTNSAAFASNGRLIAVGGPQFVSIRRARDGKLLQRQVVTYPQSEMPDPNFERELRFRAELTVR